jgi:hypothetical protein
MKTLDLDKMESRWVIHFNLNPCSYTAAFADFDLMTVFKAESADRPVSV